MIIKGGEMVTPTSTPVRYCLSCARFHRLDRFYRSHRRRTADGRPEYGSRCRESLLLMAKARYRFDSGFRERVRAAARYRARRTAASE